MELNDYGANMRARGANHMWLFHGVEGSSSSSSGGGNVEVMLKRLLYGGFDERYSRSGRNGSAYGKGGYS